LSRFESTIGGRQIDIDWDLVLVLVLRVVIDFDGKSPKDIGHNRR
jgi:hypothetical protein